METPECKRSTEARPRAVARRASPSTREKCLEKADECIRKAGESTDPLARRQFSELAGQWRDMAETAKRYGR